MVESLLLGIGGMGSEGTAAIQAQELSRLEQKNTSHGPCRHITWADQGGEYRQA